MNPSRWWWRLRKILACGRSFAADSKKLGVQLKTITGESGEAAVVTFDCHLATPQDFTKDNDKVTVAIKNIKSGCSGTRVIVDAVRTKRLHAAQAPVHQSAGRHAGERNPRRRQFGAPQGSPDQRDAAERSSIYSVDISQLAVRLNEKQDNPIPEPTMDVANQNLLHGYCEHADHCGTVFRAVQSRSRLSRCSRKSSSTPKASS